MPAPARTCLSLLLLALLGCDRGEPVPVAPSLLPRLDRPLPLQPVAIGTTAAPVLEGPRSPLGLPPPEAGEPERALDRSWPSSLIHELEGALARRDLAALARLRHGPVVQPALDREDLLRAERDFFQDGGPAFWGRVLGAIEPGALAELDLVAPVADELRLPVDLGGSVGSVVLILGREPDGWVLR